ncbi:hypothetical protein DFH09DRAFT_1311746 [Mycena vulgaris]|nr:hypothetical protein DFH09DRAFT_1311746 [Mycena vulgaris]
MPTCVPLVWQSQLSSLFPELGKFSTHVVPGLSPVARRPSPAHDVHPPAALPTAPARLRLSPGVTPTVALTLLAAVLVLAVVRAAAAAHRRLALPLSAKAIQVQAPEKSTPKTSPKPASSWLPLRLSWETLPPPPASSASASPLPRAGPVRRPEPALASRPRVEAPLPAIYESQTPVSMAKMIMNRHVRIVFQFFYFFASVAPAPFVLLFSSPYPLLPPPPLSCPFCLRALHTCNASQLHPSSVVRRRPSTLSPRVHASPLSRYRYITPAPLCAHLTSTSCRSSAGCAAALLYALPAPPLSPPDCPTYVIATLSLPPFLAYLGLASVVFPSLPHPTALLVPSLPFGGALRRTRHHHHPRLPSPVPPSPLPLPSFVRPFPARPPPFPSFSSLGGGYPVGHVLTTSRAFLPRPTLSPYPPFVHPFCDTPRGLLTRLYRPLPSASGHTPADTSSPSASRSQRCVPCRSLSPPPPSFSYPTARHPLLADIVSQTYRRPSPPSRTSV